MTHPKLFSPLAQRSLTLKNRIALSPMCQYACEDGFATDWHLVHLGARAVGGAAVVMTEATAVEPRGRISARDLGVWSDAHVEGLARVARFVEAQGAIPAIQLAHAGRKGSTRAPWEGGGPVAPGEPRGWVNVAPSAAPFREGDPVPDALDEAGIVEIVGAFGAAARRALAAGFRIAEVHAAHGYLAHQFLSPLSNRRADAWGGSFEGRSRFALEVVRAVRAAWPADLPVWMRISATDWAPGGVSPDDAVRLAAAARALGVDLVDCSSGGLVPDAKIPVAPGFQVPFAARVRREAEVASGAVGLITDPAQAEAIVASGDADVVLLGRELLRDPQWPLRAARALGADVAPPVRYARAF